MPSRKSNVSAVTNGDEDPSAPIKASRDPMGVEDFSLPRTMIQRLAKGVLPANTQIQKDALLALSKSATVFVNYLASNSSVITAAGGKKTVMPQDVYAALREMEMDAFLPRVQAEVQKYNEVQCDKRNSYRRKIKQEKEAAAPTTTGAPGEGEGQDESTISMISSDHNAANGRASRDEGIEPPSKKVRREPGDEVDEDGDEDDEGGEDEGGEDEEELADEEVPEDGDEDEEADEVDDEETEEVNEAESPDDHQPASLQMGLRDEALDDEVDSD